MSKKRILLVSCAVILLCLSLIVGVTFSLFSDSVSVKNHLKAGNLDITLTRTSLTYNTLDANGYLDETTISDPLDLTDSTDENVFGITSADNQIAPGSFFNADLQIKNNGNVAFDYSVTIKLIGESNELAEQLSVTVVKPNGSSETKSLSEFVNGATVVTGRMDNSIKTQDFSVNVLFEDGENNNDAKNKSIVFDLIVVATQVAN